jgi:hypothetical protein
VVESAAEIHHQREPAVSDTPKSSADGSVSNESGQGGIDPDAPVEKLTVGDLLNMVRQTQEAPAAGADAEVTASAIAMEVARSDRKARSDWEAAREAVARVGASPPDVQVCFLQGLIGHPDEAERFMEDPVGYARESGVLLDPVLVRDIVDTVVFGADLKERLGDRLSPGALRDIAAMRQQPNAGVMAGAATVAASAVSAATAAVRSESLAEVARLKGLDEAGIRLPGGRVLRAPRDVAVAVATMGNAVAVYGTTAVSALSAAAASDRVRLAALRGRESAKAPGKPRKT